MASKLCKTHTKYDCSEEKCKQEYQRRIRDETEDDLRHAQEAANTTTMITSMIATGLL